MILAQSQGNPMPLPPDLELLEVTPRPGGLTATFGVVAGATHYGMEATDQNTQRLRSTGPLAAATVTTDNTVTLYLDNLPASPHLLLMKAVDDVGDIQTLQ